MAALTAVALGLTALQTGLEFKGKRDAANAAEAEGNYAAGAYTTDASFADAQSADALARGAVAEQRFRQSTQGLIGAQRAGFGASGVQLSDGSALQVQQDAAALGEVDALTLRNNAARESWGFAVDAFNYRQQAVMAKRGGANAAAAYRTQSYGTLLSGAASAFGALYNPDYKSSSTPKDKTKTGVQAGGKTGGP